LDAFFEKHILFQIRIWGGKGLMAWVFKNPTVICCHSEFTIQLRAFDAGKSGGKLGVASLIALCTSLLKKSARGGLIIVGEINLGGSIETVPSAVTIAEIAVEKGASALLMPVSCRRQLFELSDDMATKIDIQFYSDARDALLKAIVE
jgi:ATP-dependent Lon protease